MKVSLVLTITLFLSHSAFASMECEQKISKHFQTLGIKPLEKMKSQDYLNGEMQALGKSVYSKTASMDDLKKSIEAAKKYEHQDSRFNEIVRVCSSIRAFAEVGMSPTDIWSKTLSFQNGWSEPMREPLASVIAKEIEQLKSADEIVDVCAPKAKPQGSGTRR